MVTNFYKTYIYVVIDSLSAEHFFTWKIIFSQGFNDTGIYRNTVIEETFFNIADELKLGKILAATTGIDSVSFIGSLSSISLITLYIAVVEINCTTFDFITCSIWCTAKLFYYLFCWERDYL